MVTVILSGLKLELKPEPYTLNPSLWVLPWLPKVGFWDPLGLSSDGDAQATAYGSCSKGGIAGKTFLKGVRTKKETYLVATNFGVRQRYHIDKSGLVPEFPTQLFLWANARLHQLAQHFKPKTLNPNPQTQTLNPKPSAEVSRAMSSVATTDGHALLQLATPAAPARPTSSPMAESVDHAATTRPPFNIWRRSTTHPVVAHPAGHSDDYVEVLVDDEDEPVHGVKGAASTAPMPEGMPERPVPSSHQPQQALGETGRDLWRNEVDNDDGDGIAADASEGGMVPGHEDGESERALTEDPEENVEGDNDVPSPREEGTGLEEEPGRWMYLLQNPEDQEQDLEGEQVALVQGRVQAVQRFGMLLNPLKTSSTIRDEQRLQSPVLLCPITRASTRVWPSLGSGHFQQQPGSSGKKVWRVRKAIQIMLQGLAMGASLLQGSLAVRWGRLPRVWLPPLPCLRPARPQGMRTGSGFFAIGMVCAVTSLSPSSVLMTNSWWEQTPKPLWTRWR